MRDWLQSEYHMPEEVHNIISQEVDNSMVEGIALIIHRLSEMPWVESIGTQWYHILKME